MTEQFILIRVLKFHEIDYLEIYHLYEKLKLKKLCILPITVSSQSENIFKI